MAVNPEKPQPQSTFRAEEESARDEDRLAREVLDLARSVLLVRFRYMDKALNELSWEPASVPCGLAVDGTKLYYSAGDVIRFFTNGEEVNNHRYMHAVLHCVFAHFWNVSGLDPELWDLACDMAVESVICGLSEPSLLTSRSAAQKDILGKIQEEAEHMTAEVLYRYLEDGGFSEKKLRQLDDLFRVDCHALWYQDAVGAGVSGTGEGREAAEQSQPGHEATAAADSVRGSRPEGSLSPGEGAGSGDAALQSFGAAAGSGTAERWRQIAREMEMSLHAFSDQAGDAPDSMTQNLRQVNREKYDYASFLRKFAVLGEKTELNMEEFDYIFYSYGLEHYGNMPLIEPLEYRDTPGVRDIVIAIDTSGSTSGMLVQAFLQKTYNILQQAESFQRHFAVHIVQCDAAIQETAVIHSAEEFDSYMATLQVHGLGGTDFRPVFEYVDQLAADGAFTKLGGIIYFTDGYGTFPARPPAYNTAFVFLDDGFSNPDVPVWAMKLLLPREELEPARTKKTRTAAPAGFLTPLS